MDIALLSATQTWLRSALNAKAYIEVLNREDIARIAGSESLSVSGRLCPFFEPNVHHSNVG
jgi:hypothetical protein